MKIYCISWSKEHKVNKETKLLNNFKKRISKKGAQKTSDHQQAKAYLESLESLFAQTDENFKLTLKRLDH